MTITQASRRWAPAYAVMLAYVLAGFWLATGWPVPPTDLSLTPFHLRRIEALALIAADPDRIRLYWSGMLLFPVALLGFSLAAPVTLDAGRSRHREASLSKLLIGFVVFGMLLTPGLGWYLLMGDDAIRASTKLGRLWLNMASGPIGLFVAGSMLLTALLFACWLSYVAIPIAWLKLRRHYREQDQQQLALRTYLATRRRRP